MTTAIAEPATDLSTGGQAGYLRIAAEEAFAPREMFAEYRRMLDRGEGDIGFQGLVGHYLLSDAERPRFTRDRLQDLGQQRLDDMDAAGIDHQIISLTAPGTQILRAGAARSIATLANDQLAEACRNHPTRYSGLAAVALQDPASAVSEIDRAISQLNLKGLIVNSHIHGEYLDNPKFFPILEAVAHLGVPMYLHPNTPSDAMIRPLREAGLDGAIYGFSVETGMHLLRIITSGIFDRLPNLRLVVGHLGEALPYWFSRIDWMHAGQVASGRYESIKPLAMRPSEYFGRNIWLTTSGMAWPPAIKFAQEVVGMDRVMYAMDYPYQYVPDEVRVQDALPIDLAEKRAFFQTIASDVFGLGPLGAGS